MRINDLEFPRPRQCKIYGLYVDKGNYEDDALVYVGSTCRDLQKRLKGHLSNPSPQVRRIIEEYGCANIHIVELLRVEEPERFKTEGLAIRLARAYGHDLVNKANIYDN